MCIIPERERKIKNKEKIAMQESQERMKNKDGPSRNVPSSGSV